MYRLTAVDEFRIRKIPFGYAIGDICRIYLILLKSEQKRSLSRSRQLYFGL